MMLRIEIAGSWTTQDFIDEFSSVQESYQIFLSVMVARRPYRYLEDYYLIERRLPFDRIDVRRMRYASPGFQDLLGIGAVFRELREFIQFWVVHFRETEDRALSRERERIEIEGMRIENTRRFVQLCDEARMPQAEVDRYLLKLGRTQETFASLAARKQVVNTSILDDDEDDESFG